MKRKDSAPDFGKIVIREAAATLKDAKTLSVEWEVDEKTTPPFAYDIKLFDNRKGAGAPLAVLSRRVAHERSATLDVSSLKPPVDHCFVHLACTDILDRRSSTAVVGIAKPTDE